MGYTGQRIRDIVKTFGYTLEVIKRPSKWFRVPNNVDVETYLKARGIDMVNGFKVLPRRWVVERTFAWLGRYRRLSKDYEYHTDTSESMLYIAMIRTMLKRFKKVNI